MKMLQRICQLTFSKRDTKTASTQAKVQSIAPHTLWNQSPQGKAIVKHKI